MKYVNLFFVVGTNPNTQRRGLPFHSLSLSLSLSHTHTQQKQNEQLKLKTQKEGGKKISKKQQK
jgi:hypothetical protein